MKKIALFFAAATAFSLAPLSQRLGPVVGAALLVLMGIALALAASGTANAIAVAFGAVGAFASGVLWSTSAAAAGAVLLTLCYAERTMRVRGAAARVAHLAGALVAGGLAGLLAGHYESADLLLRCVVVVIAAVLAALPLLVEADDPIAHTLDGLAEDLRDPAQSSLREGAELRRSADASLLDRSTRGQVAKTWRNLLRLAQARSRLEHSYAAAVPVAEAMSAKSAQGTVATEADAEVVTEKQIVPRRTHREAVVRRLDQSIAEHVATLARAFTAADDASAAEASLDDQAMRTVETTGESLEQMSKAIVEEMA